MSIPWFPTEKHAANAASVLLPMLEESVRMFQSGSDLRASPKVEESIQDIFGVIDTLRYLRKIRGSLSILSRAVEAQLSSLRKKENSRILNKGLSEIPDELLSTILETGYRSFGREPGASDYAITVSHVCRRFRNIALSTPLLWSTLSNSQSIAEINAFIPRCKAVDVIVVINEDWGRNRPAWNSRPQIDEFVNAILPLAPRWAEFRSHREYSYDDELADLWAISQRNRDFPRLKRLIVDAGHVSSTANEDEDTVESDFFHTWRMPELLFFRGNNVLPTRLTTVSFQLTTCELDLKANSPYDWDFPTLLATLSRFPCMKELNLSFEEIGTRDTPQEFPMTTLESLKRLIISVSCSNRLLVVRSFIHSLHLPHLLALHYNLIFTKSNIVSFLRSIFPSMLHCPELQSVSIEGEAKHVERSALETIFRSFPQIQNLRIAVPTFSSNYSSILDPPALPPLRFLVLQDCNLLSARAFGKIVQALSESPAWAELRRIEVNSCLYLSPSCLPSAARKLVGDKIIFKPNRSEE